LGRILENTVFAALLRREFPVFYYRNKCECDFVIKTRNKTTEAYQVCYELNPDNQDREIEGLEEALREFNLSEGILLTYKQEDIINLKGLKIKVLTVWKWLINY
jgi:uncharacterized protein